MPRPKPSATPAGPQQREAIVYVRVSSREQEDGYSIDAQLLPARFWRRGRSSFRRRGGVKRGVLFTPPVFTPGSGP